jgi:hypothetical protein
MDDQARLRQLADEAEIRRTETDKAVAPVMLFMFGALGGLIFLSFFTFVISFHFWSVVWFAVPVISGVLFKNRVENYYKEKFAE